MVDKFNLKQMRIQEISTDSRIGEFDLLLGSSFIEKGKYKNKNFSIKDIINHIRTGVSQEGGRLGIQQAIQDEKDPHTTPWDCLNRMEYDAYIPDNAMLFVSMNKNKLGKCQELYLCTRTGISVGSSGIQLDQLDFILVRGKQENKGIVKDTSFVLDDFFNKGSVLVQSDRELTIDLEVIGKTFETELMIAESAILKTNDSFLYDSRTEIHLGKGLYKIIKSQKDGSFLIFNAPLI
jgi:hypothetical protein